MIFFCLLISVMPMIRHPFWSDFMGELTMVKYLGVLCLLAALLHLRDRQTPPSFFGTWQAWAFVSLATAAMVSFVTMGAPVPWEISPFMSYVSFLMLFAVTLVLVDSLRRLRWVLLVAIGSVAYASLHVIREWQKYGGMAAGYRPGWISGDPNYYAISALICLPLAFYLMRTRQSEWERLFCLGSLVVTLVGLTLAASRGGLLGLMGMGLLVVWRSRRRLRNSAVACAVLLPLLLVSPTSPLERLINPDPHDQESADARTALWMAGLRMFQEHPVTGIGAGNFKPLVGYFGGPDEELDNVAHNTYLEIAAELGILGLLAYLGILFGSLRTLERVRQRTLLSGPPLVHQAAQGIQAGLVAYAVASFFVSAQYQKLFWLMVFLSICLPSLTTGQQRHADAPRA